MTAPITDVDAFDLLAELAAGGDIGAEAAGWLQDWAQRVAGDRDYAAHELVAARLLLVDVAAQKRRAA